MNNSLEAGGGLCSNLDADPAVSFIHLEMSILARKGPNPPNQ